LAFFAASREANSSVVESMHRVLRLFFALARGQNRGRHLAFKMLTR
jgi:hypothetical protein